MSSRPFTFTSGSPPSSLRGSDARRLFLGNLPKASTEEDIRDEVGRETPGLVRVITYKNSEDPRLHRGFCFLDYESADAAAAAMRRLSWRHVFGCRTIVDWADPEPETDADVMARVRILFVRQYGGMLDEATLATVFGRHGTVERVKNLKNYAFVHFARREDAQAAMDALDGAVDQDSGVQLDVSWAKPPADKADRERMLRDREHRMLHNGTLSRPVNVRAALAASADGQKAYDNYDHYVYDFGRSSFSCGRTDVQASSSECRCDHSSAECGDSPVGRQRVAVDSRLQDLDDCDVHASDVVDGHCTCAATSDMDDKIRTFFLKVTVGQTLGGK